MSDRRAQDGCSTQRRERNCARDDDGCRHEQLLRRVWGEEYGGETEYLWVHIRHLREKLEADPSRPRHILTERGVGYVFREPAA